MRTHVYIDGFNFYYGCLKGTKYKWVDLVKLCDALLPPNEIRSIKYFTARVASKPQADRQDAYLRALAAVGGVQIIEGQYVTHEVRRPYAKRNGSALVLDTKEKGSDVNLATHLMHDAHRDLMQCAVLVTNDSDLVEPVRIVTEELGIRVGLIPPTRAEGRYPSRRLKQHATFIKKVRMGALKACQLPDPVVTARGKIHKPERWNEGDG